MNTYIIPEIVFQPVNISVFIRLFIKIELVFTAYPLYVEIGFWVLCRLC